MLPHPVAKIIDVYINDAAIDIETTKAKVFRVMKLSSHFNFYSLYNI